LEKLETTLIDVIGKELAKDQKDVALLDVLNRLLGTVSNNLLAKK
jgi:hypothetical protein